LQLFCARFHNKGQPQLRLTLDTGRPVPDDVEMGYHDDDQESERIAKYDAERLAQWEKFAARIGVQSVLIAVKVLEGLRDEGLHSAREQRVLWLRFGLDDGRPRTLEEVGAEFNVTRERIRQIEARALRKLKVAQARKLYDAAGFNKEKLRPLTTPEDDEPPPLKWRQPRPNET